MLAPTATVDAGSSGGKLTVGWSPPNDGTNDMVLATVTNSTGERFEQGRLRFVMPKGDGTYEASGGTLVQIEDGGTVNICHVDVDIPASGQKAVRVTYSGNASTPPMTPEAAVLAQNHPNPFNPRTTIRYELPWRQSITLAIYTLDGRRVTVLDRGLRSEGPHEVVWGGHDSRGQRVASGTYVYSLSGEGFELSRRLTLLK